MGRHSTAHVVPTRYAQLRPWHTPVLVSGWGDFVGDSLLHIVVYPRTNFLDLDVFLASGVANNEMAVNLVSSHVYGGYLDSGHRLSVLMLVGIRYESKQPCCP
ncbi:uncharacterized protein G2W53_004739 [Senna tora]|uniref:Uncharacterized protein n=1 Tax=Senna tora TaxID=362788 RepID=A0A835CGQ5_9FABA|nr:uncharacterized protein G2W53_004739 [Senna tora]